LNDGGFNHTYFNVEKSFRLYDRIFRIRWQRLRNSSRKSKILIGIGDDFGREVLEQDQSYMDIKDSLHSANWLEIAEKDLDRANRLIEDDAELAGFCLQQAVEKFLKAFLISNGWEHRKSHDLVTLLDEAASYDSSLKQYRQACKKITFFYYVTLYPVITEERITKDVVINAFQQVENLIGLLRTKIRQT
jgi:HEPN domain-containing protein